MAKIVLIFKSVIDPDGKSSNDQIFIEAHDESGKSINVGEWAADGEYETLTVDCDAFSRVKEIDSLRKVTDVAKSPGNGDANEYMRGMANGLILAQHIMLDTDGEPSYLEGPTNDHNTNTARIVDLAQERSK